VAADLGQDKFYQLQGIDHSRIDYLCRSLKKNAQPSIRCVLVDEVACRCSSKANDKMMICSFDRRERGTPSLQDKILVEL
jgi:hypothetical protein